jgi:hypothetical protein
VHLAPDLDVAHAGARKRVGLAVEEDPRGGGASAAQRRGALARARLADELEDLVLDELLGGLDHGEADLLEHGVTQLATKVVDQAQVGGPPAPLAAPGLGVRGAGGLGRLLHGALLSRTRLSVTHVLATG